MSFKPDEKYSHYCPTYHATYVFYPPTDNSCVVEYNMAEGLADWTDPNQTWIRRCLLTSLDMGESLNLRHQLCRGNVMAIKGLGRSIELGEQNPDLFIVLGWDYQAEKPTITMS